MNTSTALTSVARPLVLLSEGKPIGIREYPSLHALLNANRRGIEATQQQMESIEARLSELQERELHLADLGMSAQGVGSTMTRLRGQLERLGKQKEAYEAAYMEVPDQGGDFLLDDNFVSTGTLTEEVPMDVLESLVAAKDSGIFDEFRIYRPARNARRKTDPMIVGRAGDAVFYIGSWR